MKYPNPLKPGDTIGVCAPSSGVTKNQSPRLDQAVANVEALGYSTLKTPSVRSCAKCVSTVDCEDGHATVTQELRP